MANLKIEDIMESSKITSTANHVFSLGICRNDDYLKNSTMTTYLTEPPDPVITPVVCPHCKNEPEVYKFEDNYIVECGTSACIWANNDVAELYCSIASSELMAISRWNDMAMGDSDLIAVKYNSEYYGMNQKAVSTRTTSLSG